MNILVTGASGQLGRELRKAAQGAADTYLFTDIVGDNITPLDITDAEAVRRMVRDRAITCVINCAAYTDVDRAEDDYELAERLNAEAPAILAAAMREAGGWLFHISTDYVFGGNLGNTPRTELEPANPTGVYGLTKLHAEEKICQALPQHIIIRTSWLYSPHGKNFVKTMLALTSTKPSIKVVFDQVGTPTYALDLARAIVDIIERRRYLQHAGIYHYSNEGVCSWYDFAKMIAECAGHCHCQIHPCHSSEFPSKVVRPAYSVLDKTKIKQTFALSIPYWADSLRACIARMGE